MECPICCLVPKRIAVCPHCSYASCIPCSRKYLLSIAEPQCLQCSTIWTRRILKTIHGSTFVTKEWSAHQKEILVIREESRVIHTIQEDHPEIKVIPIRCGDADCPSYVGENGKCLVCRKKTCLDCGEINLSTHQCDINIKKTFQLLQKDTKPCPKCHTPIHRFEGCPQMWCTQCRTGFDWNTMKITKDAIHNPHYFEDLRNRQQCRTTTTEISDIRSEIFIASIMSQLGDSSEDLLILDTFRQLLHDLDFPFHHVDYEQQLLQLRHKYLDKHITKTTWANRIYLIERKRMAEQDVEQFRNYKNQELTNLYRRLATGENIRADWNKLHEQMVSATAELSKLYNFTVTGII